MKSIINCKMEVQDKEKGLDTLHTNHARDIKREMEDEGDDLIPAWKKIKNFKQEPEMEYDDERMARDLELRELLDVNNLEEECNGNTRRLENEDGPVKNEHSPIEDEDGLVKNQESSVEDEDDQVEDNQAVKLPRLEDVIIGTDEEIGFQEEAEWIYEKAFSTPGISPENLVRVAIMERHVVPRGIDEVIEELPEIVSNPAFKSAAERYAEIDSINDWLLYAKAHQKLMRSLPVLYEFGPVAEPEEDWDADPPIDNKSKQIIVCSEDWDAELKAIEDKKELKKEATAAKDWAAFLKSNGEPVILPPFLRGKFVPIAEASEDWDAEIEAIEDEAKVDVKVAAKSTSDMNANNKAFTDRNAIVNSSTVILKEECVPLIELTEDWDAELEENDKPVIVSFETAKSCTMNMNDDFQEMDMDLVEEESDTEITFIEECSPKIIVTKVQSSEDPNAEVIVTDIVERCSGRRDGRRKNPNKSLMSVSPPTIKTEEFDESAVNCEKLDESVVNCEESDESVVNCEELDESAVNCEEFDESAVNCEESDESVVICEEFNESAVNCEKEIKRYSMIFKIRKALKFIHNQQTELLPATLHCDEHVDSELNDDELWKVYLWDEKWRKLAKRNDNLIYCPQEDDTYSV